MHEVFCYGMISPSIVHILDEKFTYPEANTYAEIQKTVPSIGGEAANSAIVLSKLGMSVKLDGNWLNPAKAATIRSMLGAFGIDISRLTEKDNFGTDEVVIADRDSRTVFGNYAAFHQGPKQWNIAEEADIRDAGIVALDPYFREESAAVAALCVKHGKPYVTLDAPHDSSLAQHAVGIVISHELRDQTYRGLDPLAVFKEYLSKCSGLVIFTFGSDELWYARRGEAVKKHPPYDIVPVDTTGAGDSFRGAIAYGLLKGWSDEETIDFASAVAACVCLTLPHTLNAPGLEGVQRFRAEQKERRAKR